ncbi:MAG TPA: hypothetical protein VND65_18820 [Candidatus Binatia bacterium]|nr:hypothetical protein [Candidatus Binatia bacterium]
MAFCNSCGGELAGGARFCAKCGSPILASSPDLPPRGAVPSAAAPAPAGNNFLRIALIVIAAFLVMGILAAAALGSFLHHWARRARVRHDGDNVRVETPFGTVETTKDPQAAARNLGVDLYPGATYEKDGSSSAVVGGVATVALNAETTDSPRQVCDFYQPKFPKAMVVSREGNECTIVSSDSKNMITIAAKSDGGKTRISITDVSKAGGNEK